MARMMRYAVLYCAVAFATGFAFGMIRVLYVTPAIGAFWATAIEMPLMLVFSWIAARILVARGAVARASDRLVVGLMAFVLLQFAETMLAGILGPFGFAANAAAYWLQWTPARVIGLIGQVVFAFIPLFVKPGQHHVRQKPA